MQNSVTWRWLAGALAALLLAAVGAWAGNLSGRMDRLDQTKADKTDLTLIYGRLGEIERDVKVLLQRR